MGAHRRGAGPHQRRPPGRGDPLTPISVEAYLGGILAAVRPLEPSERALADSLGLVLTEAVISSVDLPGFDNSAMDGYAVVASDVAGASADAPVRLPVLGDVAAGDTTAYDLGAGSCRRIMTGAPVPAGADAVVPVELTDGGVDAVQVREPVAAGNAIRRAGEDVRAGDLVLPAGTRLLPHHVAAASAAGAATVRVRPAPRVAVITTGDELVPVGEPLQYGQIHDSNGPMLRAAVLASGAVCAAVVHVGDRDAEPLADVVLRLAEQADAVVTSGGISAGAYEPVKDAFSSGADVRFETVAMQPGKPQAFGLVGERGVPLFGLPGNPVSSLVSFETFVAPALRVMAGRAGGPAGLRATVTRGWRSPANKLQVARVVLTRSGDDWCVEPSGAQGSHILGGLACANAVALVPPDVTQVREGDRMDVRLLPGEELPA
ncbi:molybdopterin molybdotransferase MoeA [Luteipulveratus sp. YIM 133132]|uniref:molybdopterin molybdotransferase MoeA n=1 Tax=Luteipulveratus flavus TaxID=3031728 RepID=UPI0023B02FB8|nr:gephyrin-like molybdotransferase Glp [Luteipulveratus sp. YIM 133132]MDE9364245.1 molybdopterin molybdotransferase MoeA [Luteipulveratus sp. YIM 133132]